ncbi:MAG: hypothetical protein WBK67_00335 [Minisyncoccales bacterium]|jgi:hypothetical protein
MKNRRLQSGMTFLELMVAISVLIVGISGTVGLIHRTISSATMAANQLKASYLAQEGIEVVRNIRDSSWIRDKDWLENIDSNCSCCEVAYNHDGTKAMTTCQGGNPKNLKYFQGFYGYSSNPTAEESSFSRKITTSLHDGGEYLRVEATVYWDERGSTRSVSVVENLRDWR